MRLMKINTGCILPNQNIFTQSRICSINLNVFYSRPFYSACLSSSSSEEMKKWSEGMRSYAGVKQLLCQLGFMSRDRRPSIELLRKSMGLLREIKHLDKRKSYVIR